MVGRVLQCWPKFTVICVVLELFNYNYINCNVKLLVRAKYCVNESQIRVCMKKEPGITSCI